MLARQQDLRYDCYSITDIGLSYAVVRMYLATSTIDDNKVPQMSTRLVLAGVLVLGGCTKGEVSPLAGPCTAEFDDGANGSVEVRTSFSYDVNGNMIVQETDNGADGIVDARTTCTYDVSRASAMGFKPRWATSSDCSNGNMLTESVDYGPDGSLDEYTRYSYHANGSIKATTLDSNGDGEIDTQVAFNYDDNGKMASWEFDFGADDTIDARVTFSYDQKGNEVEEIHTNGAGRTDLRLTYDYDDD
jgi:hypothetical protein